ncbi:hypothetical protein ABIE65_005599 [Constrictibacter sp. MBR-5]|jgi:hypothetical protein|uniref:hypothetical protein n=1 Tax=Constrictibacter sp. MBR-5 TaxID=3156467 RepID=UPI0033992897
MNVQALLEAIDGIALVIDRDLRVSAVGTGNWDRFWAENGGADGGFAILGKDITMSFSPGVVRDTYRKLFTEVLEMKRQAICVDYRCDAPAARRQMRLSVTPIVTSAGRTHLLYQSTLLSMEQRPPIPLFAARTGEENEPGAVRICAVCAKVEWPDEHAPGAMAWIEPQEYYRRGGSDVTVMSHGFCQPCYERMVAEDM